MKKQLFLSFCVLSLNAFSQNVTIPDANFKNYLISNLEVNTNGDNEIQISEASTYSDSLFCVSLSISDMTGIEAFTNLKFLSCVNNSIANLDLSQNVALEDLICAMNPITSLDLTLNVNLKNLRCDYNPLSNLD